MEIKLYILSNLCNINDRRRYKSNIILCKSFYLLNKRLVIPTKVHVPSYFCLFQKKIVNRRYGGLIKKLVLKAIPEYFSVNSAA